MKNVVLLFNFVVHEKYVNYIFVWKKQKFSSSSSLIHERAMLTIESGNHRIVWVERGFKDHQVVKFLSCPGTPSNRPSC